MGVWYRHGRLCCGEDREEKTSMYNEGYCCKVDGDKPCEARAKWNVLVDGEAPEMFHQTCDAHLADFCRFGDLTHVWPAEKERENSHD